MAHSVYPRSIRHHTPSDFGRTAAFPAHVDRRPPLHCSDYQAYRPTSFHFTRRCLKGRRTKPFKALYFSVALWRSISFSYVRSSFSFVFQLQLQELEASIRDVEKTIKDIEAELKTVQDPEEKKYLRTKETLLCTKETQLRDELKQLRDKEKELRSELKPHRAKELLRIDEIRQYPRGTLPYPGASNPGFSEQLWIAMCHEVQQNVLKCLQAKASLSAVKALSNMRAGIKEADAAKFGIKVLLARDGKILLGLFDVPELNNIVDVSAPKGTVFSTLTPVMRSCSFSFLFVGFLFDETRFFYVPERAALVDELLQAMKVNQLKPTKSGVLVTGSNGVGKSALGLLAFECCQAAGLLAVYIPDAKAWVIAAGKGAGDTFLLEQFFRQNVHTIAATPSLYSIFEARLRGKQVTDDMMPKLRDALSRDEIPRPSVAVIVDEVQNITNAVDIVVAGASTEDRAAATYFRNGWTSWTTPNSCFVRMDIASSHGTRELKLPDGDDHRLRYVRPWKLELARAALSEVDSPAYVAQVAAHDRMIHIAGGVIRKLLKCRDALPAGAVTQKSMGIMEHEMRLAMQLDCDHWLDKLLDDAGRLDVARSIAPLFQGKVSWSLMKGAYDSGLVALLDSNVFVQPVSPVAGSVLHQRLAAVLRKLKHLSLTPPDGSERGYELERQIAAHLDPCTWKISTKRLSGVSDSAVNIRVDYTLHFDHLQDTALGPTLSNSHSILFKPTVSNYRCDGIIVLATRPVADLDASSGDNTGTVVNSPVLVLEYSLTDPRDSERVEKIKNWFKPDGFIASLRKVHPNRPITILLFWPETLQENTAHTKYMELQSAADEASVQLRVVDSAGLSQLGVSV